MELRQLRRELKIKAAFRHLNAFFTVEKMHLKKSIVEIVAIGPRKTICEETIRMIKKKGSFEYE